MTGDRVTWKGVFVHILVFVTTSAAEQLDATLGLIRFLVSRSLRGFDGRINLV